MVQGHSGLLDRIRVLTGTRDDLDAQRIARGTLEVLLEVLPHDVRTGLSAALPATLRARAVAEITRPSESLEAFYERVAAREGVAIGTAVEHAQCVCRALAEQLDADAHSRLLRGLPDVLSPLFVQPEAAAPLPPRSRHPSRVPHTLAAGHAGSQRPLADAAPSSAHTHSIARTDDPHGDTKLSSTTGATQEREDETLAAGRPGSRRSLGDS